MTPSAPICGHAIPWNHKPRRGLCKNCNLKLYSLVRRKLTTYVEAERTGKCLPDDGIRHPWAQPLGKGD